MFRFSASSKRPVNVEEIEDVLKGWGKLALASIFLAGSLALPHAFANPVSSQQAHMALDQPEFLLK